MARYSTTLRDQYKRPISGALVYVTLSPNDSLANLTNDDGSSLSNPFTTGYDGSVVFNATSGVYDITYWYGGRKYREDFGVSLGNVLPGSAIVDALGEGTDVAASQRAVTDALSATNASIASKVDAAGALAASVGTDLTQAPSNTNIASRIPAATFDAAPALILPASTPLIDITGKSVSGDYAETAAYRAVATQPSHQGKFQVGSQWYELIGGYVMPDWFIRTGDTDDSASWNRARDYMVSKGIVTMQLGPRPYDITSGQVSFNGIAAQLIGRGYTENGNVNGWNNNLIQSGETAKGTWVRCGSTSFRALTFSGTNSKGARIDRLGFVQTHPNAVAGWSPTPYDYIIENNNVFGGMTIGDVMFLGINKGIQCIQSGRLVLEFFKGQFYTEGLYLDIALDSTIIPKMHIWTYNGLLDPVAVWQKNNSKTMRIFRCDGIDGGTAFALGVNTMLELNTSANGSPTDIHFDKMWSDVSKYGIYNNASAARVTINDFVGQCEDFSTHNGSAIAGSYGYYGTASSGGALITFGNCRFERFSGGGIYNGSTSSTILVKGNILADNQNGAPILKTVSGGVPIRMDCAAPFINDGTGSFGIQGVDYVLPSNDQSFNYTATVDGSGNINISHGLGNNGVWGFRGAIAVCKGNSGEAVPMTFTGMDGTGIGFTVSSAFSGRQARVTIRTSYETPPSW